MKDNMKSSKQWKKYEWLVTKIYHDVLSSGNVKIQHNARIRGKISGQIRQIDVLIIETVADKERVTIIDCKKLGGRVDIKGVEEFLGMFDDTQADYGIIISAEGFTVGAERRVENREDITLETIDWERAFEQAERAWIPNRLTDLCKSCLNPDSYGKGVPGLILWEFQTATDGKLWYLFFTGKCLKCNALWLYCDSCGTMCEIHKEDYICEFCSIDYNAAVVPME